MVWDLYLATLMYPYLVGVAWMPSIMCSVVPLVLWSMPE